MSHSVGWCGWVETPSLWFSLKTPDPFSVSLQLFILSRRWSTAQAERQLDGVLAGFNHFWGVSFIQVLSQMIRRQRVRRSSDVQPSTVSAINTGSKDPLSGPWSACPSPPQVVRRAGKQSKKQQRQQQRQRFYPWSSLIEVSRGVLAVSERASAQAPCWNWQQVELWHVSWEHGSASRRFGAVVVFADSAN